jgi:endonuclease YncB( thermonuclease family)
MARRTWVVLLLVAVALGAAAAQRAPVNPVLGPAPVIEVLDGDTVVLRSNLGPRTVRLIGIDTPEVAHPEKGREPFGPEASAFTKALLPPGTEVRVELDLEAEDVHGRLLAYLYLENDEGAWVIDGRRYAMANLEIARSGWATVLTIPPNGVYADLFEAAVATARRAGRGMFAPDDPPVGVDEAGEVFGGAGPGGAGPIRIACVNYDPSAELDKDAEWVALEILEPVDTRGMYVYDRGSKKRFFLPAGEQPPGRIHVRNPGQGVWNNGGDTVVLMRGTSELLDEWTYRPTGREDDPVCREGAR